MRTVFCNFTNFKIAESRKWNRVPLKYKSSRNLLYSVTPQWSQGRTEVRFPRDTIFISATTPAFVGSILGYDNILILIFLIISIAFVMIEQLSFRVSCHSACFIKIKMAKTTFDNKSVGRSRKFVFSYNSVVTFIQLYHCYFYTIVSLFCKFLR